MPLTNDVVAKEIRGVTKEPFDFWLLNLKNDYRNLALFFDKVDIPRGAELFTSEGVFPGKAADPIFKEAPYVCETVNDLRPCTRSLLIEFAKGMQGVRSATPQPEIRKIIGRAKRKGVKLWLGTPYFEEGPRLYNAYVLFENGEISFVHRKKFLWAGKKDSEVGIYEACGTDRRAAISTKTYDGIFEKRAYLICQEADAYYCDKWRERPTHIPEVRAARPEFVVIPAHWCGFDGDSPTQIKKHADVLVRTARMIARRIEDPIDRLSAVRKQGVIVLVVNAHEVYVCGPVSEEHTKVRVYARQPERGWLRITNDGVTTGTF